MESSSKRPKKTSGLKPTEEETSISFPDLDTWEILPTEIDDGESPKQKNAM